MHTLDEWKAVLAKDFFELQHLEGQDASTRMRRFLKEQEIGQHCCQAGERLGDPDLALLNMKSWRTSRWVKPLLSVSLGRKVSPMLVGGRGLHG